MLKLSDGRLAKIRVNDATHGFCNADALRSVGQLLHYIDALKAELDFERASIATRQSDIDALQAELKTAGEQRSETETNLLGSLGAYEKQVVKLEAELTEERKDGSRLDKLERVMLHGRPALNFFLSWDSDNKAECCIQNEDNENEEWRAPTLRAAIDDIKETK